MTPSSETRRATIITVVSTRLKANAQYIESHRSILAQETNRLVTWPMSAGETPVMDLDEAIGNRQLIIKQPVQAPPDP